MPDCSVDSVVTDPPYGLSNTAPDQVADTLARWVSGDHEHTPHARGGFMGKTWDSFVPPPAVWTECLRVLKPGGHMLVFAGSRTQDLMGLSIRLAGFEIRDGLSWLYGSGFPKTMDVAKAVDKAVGASGSRGEMKRNGERLLRQTAGGKRSGGGTWGDEIGRSAYKYVPGSPEARKWQGWGTALKPAQEPIILARKPLSGTVAANILENGTGCLNVARCEVEAGDGGSGRYPANVLIDEFTADCMDALNGRSSLFPTFRYEPKASQREKPEVGGIKHPTVKPLSLMRWLVALVTPPGGAVLDPFAGSGTTIEAAMLEGMRPIGIETEPDYIPLIRQRIERCEAQGPTLS